MRQGTGMQLLEQVQDDGAGSLIKCGSYKQAKLPLGASNHTYFHSHQHFLTCL